MPIKPMLGDMTNPLVSVLVHNYNYGRYLRQCLESIFAQTYDNIEICFSDNASTDNSWDIALEFAKKYPGVMTATRNRKNSGSDANFQNCLQNAKGKYFVGLCSDDVLMPDFVAKCVHALERHPNAGYAMVHRTIIDEHGRQTVEPPFYNQSCVIPGKEQAAVYMMATVNPSVSQIMYNRAMISGKRARGSVAYRWFGMRILDFNMCCVYDIAYINEPLLLHRMHPHNDTSTVAGNLVEAFGQFVLLHQFADIASHHDRMEKAIGRLPQALEKLGKLCLRYCARALCANDARCALRYFHLALAIMPEITEEPTFQQLQAYWTADTSSKAEIVEGLKATANLISRTVSYDPPPGSIAIEPKH